jgi:hypothetical protein
MTNEWQKWGGEAVNGSGGVCDGSVESARSQYTTDLGSAVKQSVVFVRDPSQYFVAIMLRVCPGY